MMLKHKGYIGSVEVDVDAGILYGKLLHIRDLVNYEAETPAKLKAEFEAAVEEYLEDCIEDGIEPDVPFKGQFNVRVTPSLHRELAISAKSQGRTMNDYVEHVLKNHEQLDAVVTVQAWRKSFVLQSVQGRTKAAQVMKTQAHERKVAPTKNSPSWFVQGKMSDARH